VRGPASRHQPLHQPAARRRQPKEWRSPGRSQWLVVIARQTALSEDTGSDLVADGCVYCDGHCDMQPWARAVHLL